MPCIASVHLLRDVQGTLSYSIINLCTLYHFSLLYASFFTLRFLNFTLRFLNLLLFYRNSRITRNIVVYLGLSIKKVCKKVCNFFIFVCSFFTHLVHHRQALFINNQLRVTQEIRIVVDCMKFFIAYCVNSAIIVLYVFPCQRAPPPNRLTGFLISMYAFLNFPDCCLGILHLFTLGCSF